MTSLKIDLHNPVLICGQCSAKAAILRHSR